MADNRSLAEHLMNMGSMFVDEYAPKYPGTIAHALMQYPGMVGDAIQAGYGALSPNAMKKMPSISKKGRELLESKGIESAGGLAEMLLDPVNFLGIGAILKAKKIPLKFDKPTHTEEGLPIIENIEEAHKVAQHNASLPIGKGGLGLPEDNSAMERAKALGFDIDTLLMHGTSAEIEAFDVAKYGSKTSKDIVGKLGVSTTDDPYVAEFFSRLSAERSQGVGMSERTIPLLHRYEKGASMELSENVLSKEVAGSIQDAWDNDYDSLRLTNYNIPEGHKSNMYMVKNPAQLRSPQARFDPLMRESSNLLAGISAPVTSAYLADILMNEQQQNNGI